jgi:hypothetical protein
MTRYSFSTDDLNHQIDQTARTWRRRAAERTQQIIRAGRFDQESSIWSEIKPVFMKLQHSKCAFCERRLATADYGGTIEHDLEHFRPKSSVKVWTSDEGLRYSFGPASSTGYYWLAYDPANYAVSCKKCNSPLKADHFPIAGNRGSPTATVDELNTSERPDLIYPLGDSGDDPRTLITFQGIIAIPVQRRGPLRRRAEVTIEFFRLNSREELLRARAEVLDSLGHHLETLNDPSTSRERRNSVMKTIQRMRARSAQHTACVLAMMELYQTNPTTGRQLIDEARSYLESLP